MVSSAYIQMVQQCDRKFKDKDKRKNICQNVGNLKNLNGGFMAIPCTGLSIFMFVFS